MNSKGDKSRQSWEYFSYTKEDKARADVWNIHGDGQIFSIAKGGLIARPGKWQNLQGGQINQISKRIRLGWIFGIDKGTSQGRRVVFIVKGRLISGPGNGQELLLW